MKKAQLWEQILFLKVKLSGEGKDEKSTAVSPESVSFTLKYISLN